MPRNLLTMFSIFSGNKISRTMEQISGCKNRTDWRLEISPGVVSVLPSTPSYSHSESLYWADWTEVTRRCLSCQCSLVRWLAGSQCWLVAVWRCEAGAPAVKWQAGSCSWAEPSRGDHRAAATTFHRPPRVPVRWSCDGKSKYFAVTLQRFDQPAHHWSHWGHISFVGIRKIQISSLSKISVFESLQMMS